VPAIKRLCGLWTFANFDHVPSHCYRASFVRHCARSFRVSSSFLCPAGHPLRSTDNPVCLSNGVLHSPARRYSSTCLRPLRQVCHTCFDVPTSDPRISWAHQLSSTVGIKTPGGHQIRAVLTLTPNISVCLWERA